MKLSKSLLVVLGAATLLGALVASASANRLSVSTQSMRATWSGMEFSGGFGTVRCAVTLEGSVHSRTITETAGALVGAITRASVGACAQGSATVLTATLPWHLQYASFSGTLPRIESITFNMIGASFQVREPVFGITCLARSTVEDPWWLRWLLDAFGAVKSFFAGGTTNSNDCGTQIIINGNSNTVNVITVTLI